MSGNCRFTVAVHICAILATCPTGTTSGQIAHSLNANPVIARRILLALTKAGLVDSQRGSRGGYRLSRPGDTITLADIASAVDDRHNATFLVRPPRAECRIGRTIQPILSDMIAEAEAARLAALSQVTLSCVVSRILDTADPPFLFSTP